MRNFLIKILPHNLRSELGRIKRYIKYAYNINIMKHGELKECPICNKELAIFLPYGPDKKPIHCPYCSSFPRHRALWLYLKMIGLPEKESSILHISPEPSFLGIFKNRNNYIAIDKFADGYSYPKSVLKMDIEHLDFIDNTFDIVICSHVLEHVDNDYNALREMARVTKKNGVVLIMVPIDKDTPNTYEDKNIIKPEERLKHFGQEDHVRLYGMDFPARVEAVGFQCITHNTQDLFNEEYFLRYGLEDDFIFHLKPDKLGIL
jgi:SAM-dependent methyltransferase